MSVRGRQVAPRRDRSVYVLREIEPVDLPQLLRRSIRTAFSPDMGDVIAGNGQRALSRIGSDRAASLRLYCDGGIGVSAEVRRAARMHTLKRNHLEREQIEADTTRET